MGEKKDETIDLLFSMKDKMDRFFAASASESAPFCLQSGSQWSLAVDLFDLGTEYQVVIDLPGVDKSQVNLSIAVDKLVIKGRRETEFEVPENAEVICLERGHGRFERVILLPDPVDADQVRAVFRDGVLKIRAVKKTMKVTRKSIVIE
jgi:HSP20 family protein